MTLSQSDKRITQGIFLVLLLLASSPTMVSADHTPSTLELIIHSDKATYKIGDPIWLNIGLYNTGTDTINVPEFFILPADDPAKNNLKIRVRDSAGNPLDRISHTMTGRALYYPEIQSIDANGDYQTTVQIAGAYKNDIDNKKLERTLWNLGENPEITHANEYHAVILGRFMIQVFYEVIDEHLDILNEEQRKVIWKGKLSSNIVEISIE